jgi:hypothetical protein
MMVLPNNLWKGPDAKVSVTVQKTVKIPAKTAKKSVRV